MRQAIQILEECHDGFTATEIAGALAAQDGVTHIRTLAPSSSKPLWRVQAIMETNGDALNGWLPDGMRHVLVSDAILASFTRL